MRIRSRHTDERGNISLFVVVIALGLFAMVGLVVDGGGKIRALQRAEAVAAEAARSGGQAIQIPSAVRGEGARINTAAARNAAQQYLNQAGVNGDVTIINGTRLRVTATTSHQPVFLSLLGTGPLTTTGTAEVRLAQTGGTP
ncbi:pilus assembly protein TadG-related protein [Nocardioides sp.]|uniref:pilus assembly protein TadG-related protein n=1 Tax=Nocardioides sp. TaxID=35761 RepID=UPI0027372136|nr:pilus assembly protein TadG-related protein [Nocardioides sp.]MDP3893635.1 pilus assembly protein [Nocardioides sp.]